MQKSCRRQPARIKVRLSFCFFARRYFAEGTVCRRAGAKEDADTKTRKKYDESLTASDLLLRRFKKISGEFTATGLVKITFPAEEQKSNGKNKNTVFG